MTLSLTTSTLPDGAVAIAPTGEIDTDNAYEIKDAVATLLANGRPPRVELDMRRVTFVDSAGIRALVAAFQIASVSGVRLVVTNPSRFAHRQLWVTGLLGLFGNPQPYAEVPVGAAARG